ncbi:MAG: hypothetical protein Q6368_003105 [Candidatus Baldrarchaeota archaeon]
MAEQTQTVDINVSQHYDKGVVGMVLALVSRELVKEAIERNSATATSLKEATQEAMIIANTIAKIVAAFDVQREFEEWCNTIKWVEEDEVC